MVIGVLMVIVVAEAKVLFNLLRSVAVLNKVVWMLAGVIEDGEFVGIRRRIALIQEAEEEE